MAGSTDEREPPGGKGSKGRKAGGRRDLRDAPMYWMRYSSKGFELAAAVLGMGLFGYWLGGLKDRALLGLAIGAVLGIVGGMYNLVRQSWIASRQADAKNRNQEN